MSTNTINHTGRQVVTGLTAAGSSQATGLQLAGLNSLQEITTVAASTGVVLPVIKLPAAVTIANQGASTLSIYPSLGGTIDGGSANAAVTLAAGKSATFQASSLTNWYTVASTTSGGGGSGTVNSGTTGQIAVYASSGTAVSGANTGIKITSSTRPTTADTPSAGVWTVDCSASDYHKTTLAANTTFVISNATTDQNIILRVQQAASGGPYTLTFTGTGITTITWMTSNFSAPTMPTTANGVLCVLLRCTGAGTYDGFLSGTSAS
jgi:hypothetical protein